MKLKSNLFIHLDNVTEAKELIEGGADVNYKHDHGWRPLHVASRLGFVDIARMLIDRHADIDIKNEVNDTPCHLAGQIKESIQIPVFFYMFAYNFIIPIFAAIGDHVKVIELLADSGAKLNERNFQGETPIHLASKTGTFLQ